MTEYIQTVRESLPHLSRAVLSYIEVDRNGRCAVLHVITDQPYTREDLVRLNELSRPYVPEYFTCVVDLVKLSPDETMVRRKIEEFIKVRYPMVSATMQEGDIVVERTRTGFAFSIAVMVNRTGKQEMAANICKYLRKCFCGDIHGVVEESSRSVEDIQLEELHENIEYTVPVRTFAIEDFESIEGTEIPTFAVYLADLNFEAEKLVLCGKIVDIVERTYKRKNDEEGKEKTYFSITINDGTAQMRMTYFARQKSIDKIKELKVDDWIVTTGKSELYNGSLRYTANLIDYGRQTEGFVPEKRKGKPCPRYYETVFPQPFEDYEQDNLFKSIDPPACMKDKEFVVLDLETTGLNSSPVGVMDKIIEIGAYKISNGVITESFTTFVNPEQYLSSEIIELTGIKDEDVADAPVFEKVMPDFYKFCYGCILVGHNIAGFDYKFLDYYCGKCGYRLERKLMDTLPMSQKQFFLPNYKLNTVADQFGIQFNHHRAIDDALVTAKIFIELVRIKKSLPDLV